MSSEQIIQGLILLILIILSGFFSSAETALTTVNRIRLKNLADDGNRKAARVLQILDSSDKMLSCILIGNNIVNISASSLATTLAISLFGSRSVGFMTGALTLIVLIFGEITPKNAANANSENLSLRYGGIIHFLMVVMTPLIFLVNHLAGGVMKLLHIRVENADSLVTEDEIRTLVDVSHEDGETTGTEREMINNVYDFGDQTASDIMVPRADMVVVSTEDDYDTVAEIYRSERFTRLPVYEKDRDHIVGVLNLKDFCFVEDRNSFRPKDLMYAPYYTFETKPVSDLLAEMRENSATLTIVLDEYGSAAGMLTFEDLMEELVGEIRDEYDENEKEWIRKLSEREYLIEGGVKLDDINDRIGTSVSSEEYDSIGGYVIERLDHLPVAHEKVQTEDGLVLSVESMNRKRIGRVRLTLPEKTAEEG